MRKNHFILVLLFFLGISIHAQTLNYQGSDEIYKNPERGFSYKAGYIDLFVDDYSYDGDISFVFNQNFYPACTSNSVSRSYVKRIRHREQQKLVLPRIDVFKNNTSNQLHEINNDLPFPVNNNEYIDFDFVCPLNVQNLPSNVVLFKLSYTNGQGVAEAVSILSNGVKIQVITSLGDVAPFILPELENLYLKNIDGTSNTNAKLVKIAVNDLVDNSIQFSISLNHPVKVELHPAVKSLMANHYEGSGILVNGIEMNNANLEKEESNLQMDIRTALSFNENVSIDLENQTISPNYLSTKINIDYSNHVLTFNNSFFENHITNAQNNILNVDECKVERDGISIVEVEEYLHFSEDNIQNSQKNISGSSVTRMNNAFNLIKNNGLKINQITNSDFRMKANNTQILAPSNSDYTYLMNIMDEMNSEIYSSHKDLVAFNTLGWIRDQDELNLYRLSPTWLKYYKHRADLHRSNIVEYYSEFLPNEEGSLRTSHQKFQFRFSAALQSSFTANGCLATQSSGYYDQYIQVYQEAVMNKLAQYYPKKKMTTDQVIAWQHKFTNSATCTSFENVGTDGYNLNPNLGYYDGAFATTFDHLATLSYQPQSQSPDYNLPPPPGGSAIVIQNPPELSSVEKRDLYVLGKYGDRFWSHGEMPVYYASDSFDIYYDHMDTVTSWRNNFQFNYNTFKNMLSAQGTEQDPVLAAKKLFMFNYTSFDITHSNSDDLGVNLYEFIEPNGNGAIDNWKKTEMTQAIADDHKLPYSTDYFTDNYRSVYDYIRDHLGYRLELQSLESSMSGNTMTLDLDIQNRGFAAPKNPRAFKIVIMDQNGNHVKEQSFPENEWTTWYCSESLKNRKNIIDNTNYQNYNLDDPIFSSPQNYKTHSISASINLSGLAANQDYSIALYMPDPSNTLATSDKKIDFAVKLANNELILGRKGENILATFNNSGTRTISKPSMENHYTTQNITQNTTWSTPQNPLGDIIVKAGKKLTITSTVNMPKNSRIVVEKGATLRVNGGTITNSCNATWRGIQLKGDNGLSQGQIANQGRVYLSHATIENARDGVSVIGKDVQGNIQWGTAGGRLYAYHSSFINCRRGVEFMSYTSPNGAKNKSSIVNCSFEWDEDFLEVHGSFPNDKPVGVSMWDVEGVKVRGCTFENKLSAPSASNTDVHKKFEGWGIYLREASPIIEAYKLCDVWGNNCVTTRGKFKGLDNAIYGYDVDLNNPVSISGYDFEDNKLGIYFHHYDHITVHDNTFDIPEIYAPNTTGYQVKRTGIYFNDVSDMVVENNSFSSDNAVTFDGGMVIEDLGTANQRIYNNSFENLSYAFLAYGNNGITNTSGGLNTPSGTELKCNDFGLTHANFQDWYINAGASVKPMQGQLGANTTDPAGNRFSNPPENSNGQGHIFVGVGGFKIDRYVYHNSPNEPLIPIYSDNNKVVSISSPHDFLKESSCPQTDFNTNNGGVILTDINTYQGQLATLVNNSEAILNGGIRPQIMSALLDAEMNSQQIKELLIQGSPYLDDEVLIAAITREIPLNPWHLTQVLVWNSRLSPQVMEVLYQEQPLTPFQFNLVLNEDGNSQRFLLEIQIHQLQRKIDFARQDYLYIQSKDSSVNYQDALLQIYANDPSPKARAKRIAARIKKKQYALAQAEINAYTTTDPEDKFVEYYSLKLDLAERGKNWMAAEESEKQSLQSIAETDLGFVGKNAQQLLYLLADSVLTFEDKILDFTQPQARKAYVGIPEEDVSGITEISYIAQDKELLIINTNEVLAYQIFNSQGQLLKSGTLEKGVETLSVVEFTPGAYIIQTHENNQNQCYEKFVVY